MSEELKSALQSIQGFSALSAAALDVLAGFSSFRNIRAGETVFAQNEPSPFCFGVLSGEVAIQRVAKDVRLPMKVLGLIGPGGLFGESAIFGDRARTAMASTIKEGKLVVVRGPQLREWILKNPAESQPLLLALLQSAQGRLHRTSHELAVVYGIGRLLGSEKDFSEQLGLVFQFLKGSLESLEDLVFYQRNPFWEEFTPVLSLPELPDLPAAPLQNVMVQKVVSTGSSHVFQPASCRPALEELKLPFDGRAALAIVPLFDWDKSTDPLQGLLVLTSAQDAQAFSFEKQLLLTAIAQPLAESLSRHFRKEDANAQERLAQTRKSFPQ